MRINSNLQTKNVNFYGSPKLCNIFKCKANCCKNAPLPLDLLEIHKDKIVNTVAFTKPMGLVDGKLWGFPVTNIKNLFENKCPFLTKANRCNIYEHRPKICREYGTLDTPSCRCHLQI